MSRLSPGWATDLAILELTGSTVVARPDHIVVRTPTNPAYHWGNCLLVTDPAAVDDAERWRDRFHRAFPDATWIAIGLPRMPRATDAWTVQGIDLEEDEVLTSSSAPHGAPLPDGYSVRRLGGDDWGLVIDRELAENARTGEYESCAHEQFVRASVAARRELNERDVAAYFGAFANASLCAELGVVRCGTTARYQAVATEPEHRRRGLASHLLGVAATWSADAGCTSWVIVTETTNDAGRVYRRAGFAPDQGAVSAYRRPPLTTT